MSGSELNNPNSYPNIIVTVPSSDTALTVTTSTINADIIDPNLYPTLNVNVTSQYPVLKILTAPPIIIGSGSGSSSFSPGGPGPMGPTGATGATGSISINQILAPSYSGITKTSSFVSGTQGSARKLVFLAQDGSLTFDYLRNYDVLTNTDLTFNIISFTTNINTNTLIGTTSFNLNSKTIAASYNPIGTNLATTGYITCSTGTNFPLTLSPPYTSGSFTNQTIPYTSAPQAYSLVLNTSDGQNAYTSTIGFNFFNNVYHGTGTASCVAPGATTVPSNFITILSNTKERQFTNTPYTGITYIHYCYPLRLGPVSAFYYINNLGVQSSSPVSFTPSLRYLINTNGYGETYYIYSSASTTNTSATQVLVI